MKDFKETMINLGVLLYEHYAVQMITIKALLSCSILIIQQLLPELNFISDTWFNKLSYGLILDIVAVFLIIMAKCYDETHNND